jgi:hypothetical protein
MRTTVMTARRPRAIGALLGMLLILVLVGMATPRVSAQGLTVDQLDSRWTCFTPPPRPDLVVCYNHGLGRPSPTDPNPPPSFSNIRFSSATGEFLSTGHLIRADLYNGRPCAPGDELYLLLGLLGYYECVHV